jgi:putative ABC transport system permease protein
MLQDLRYGLRALRRSPVFTAVAVVSIAGGLTAATVAFAFMNAVLFRPLGVTEGHEFYRLYTSAHRGELYSSSSYADYEAFRERRDIFAATCAIERVRANLLAAGTAALHEGAIVSPECFDALRLPAPLGRYFSGDDATASATPMPVVISHTLWKERFAGDPTVIGRTVLLNGVSMAITAVTPRGFAGTSLDGGADFWAPIHLAPVVLPPGALLERRNRMFNVFARLQPGVSVQQAEAALAVVAENLRRLDERAWAQESGVTRRVTVMRETDARFAGSPSGPLGIMAGVIAAVVIVIGIACLNLATMFLARGASRGREVSIRLAIGATRARILRLLIAESLAIALLGGLVATVSVAAGVRLFEAYRPAVIPAFDLALDWRVLTFTAVVALAAALLFGLAPAVHTLRTALAEGLKGRAIAGGARLFRVPARETLIVLQVAVSIALLVVSTLFVRARAAGGSLSPGFDVTGVAASSMEFEALPDADVPVVREAILAAARDVPGVDRVSLARVIPLSGSSMGLYVTDASGAKREVLGNGISPGYFETLSMPLVAGRDFAARDDAGGAAVAIVSATYAQRAWGTGQAIGRTIIVDEKRMEVIGVAQDARYRALTEPFKEVVYLPISQMRQKHFILHARVGAGESMVALERAIRRADPRVGVSGVTMLAARMDAATAPERAAQWAGGIVGFAQLGLAIMALWGLVTYAVERRTNEMGIRLALGAEPSSLVRLVLRPAGIAIVIGVGLGAALGAGVAQVVQSTSVGLAPLQLVAVVPVAAIFTVVTIAAAWWPARRAGMQDPAVSLRRE